MILKWCHIVFFIFLSCLSWGQNDDKGRLSAFEEHKKEQLQFESARAKGERAYLEEEEKRENQKNRNLQEYKKTKKEILMTEDGPEAAEDAAVKKRFAENYEKELKAFTAKQKRQENLDRKKLKLPSEAQELGLDEPRPRYDYRRRSVYGAKPKFGKGTDVGSSRGGSLPSRGSAPGGSAPSFPPPPSFDDFGDDGYVPAPNMDDFGDVPPPPPPPPLPFGGDDGGVDDFPPPPPPPPPFGGDDDF